MSIKIFLPILILASGFYSVFGYSSGAPKQACNDLIPQHGVPSSGYQSYHHFTIDKDIFRFGLGEKIPINLFVTAPDPEFKGFIVQVCFDIDYSDSHCGGSQANKRHGVSFLIKITGSQIVFQYFQYPFGD